MNNVNKTLYIPLYGKAFVSKKGIILEDLKAEEIWEREGFVLKGKAKSKWLAYFMAMRAAVYDQWVKEEIEARPEAVVLHIGCGLDGRIKRLGREDVLWYDIDFPEVIEERRKYYDEGDFYRMLPADMRLDDWKDSIEGNKDAIVIMEGVSMYFKPEELFGLLEKLGQHFGSVRILMDCYSQAAAKASKYKNPINEVGVTTVYGYDDPEEIAREGGLVFEGEYSITPDKYIDQLDAMEKTIFKKVFAGKVAGSIYKMYQFKKGIGG